MSAARSWLGEVMIGGTRESVERMPVPGRKMVPS
jgi:hypothetical protein